MKKVVIYVEGGGDSAAQKAELRQGFDSLLKSQKQVAAGNGVSLRIVCCGSRNETYRRFIQGVKTDRGDTEAVLLVDSEEALNPGVTGQTDSNATARKAHLTKRDKWDLREVHE